MSETVTMRRVVIHRGPIPGTNIGHHWFDAADGKRYGVLGWPHGINKGWPYEVVDSEGRLVDDSMFSLDEIREWAALCPECGQTSAMHTRAGRSGPNRWCEPK